MNVPVFEIYTNIGSRKINEDSCGAACYEKSFCYVVADGLGGHGGGEVASAMAVDAICEMFVQEGWSSHFFEKAINQAQKLILEEQERQHAPSRMKTTVVVLVLHEGMAYWAHVGDSRLYFFKNRKLKKRTLDHSVPQMLALAGDIKESEIRHHSDRSRLLRVVGIKGEAPKIEIAEPVKLKGESTFLMCTDGFWELEDDRDMERLLASAGSMKKWLSDQAELICRNGENTNMDNFTAIAVHIKTPSLFGR